MMRAVHSRTQKYLSLAGVVGPFFYFLLLAILGQLWAGYNPVRDSMSELGAVDSPYRTIMNVFGFMGLGVSILLFALVYYYQMERGWLTQLALFFLAIAGVFMIVVGFFPCDAGCIDVTTTSRLHSLTSIPQSIALPLAAISSAFVLGKDSRFGQRWAIASFWLGVASLATGPLMSFSFSQPIIGLVQRLGIGLSLLWMMLISMQFFTQLSHTSENRF